MSRTFLNSNMPTLEEYDEHNEARRNAQLEAASMIYKLARERYKFNMKRAAIETAIAAVFVLGIHFAITERVHPFISFPLFFGFGHFITTALFSVKKARNQI